MKDNLTKIIRQALLKEDATSEMANKITNPSLKIAWNAGCFPASAQVFTLGGEQVIWTNSTKVAGYPVAVLRAPVLGASTGVLEYWKNDGGKLTEKSPKVLSWSCAALRKLEEESVNPELGKFVGQVRTANPDLQIFTYKDEGVSDDNKVNGVCKLQKLIDVVNDPKNNLTDGNIPSLLTPQLQPMHVWVCAQSSTTAGNKAELDYYSKMGYKKCDDAQIRSIESRASGKVQGQIDSVVFAKVGGVYMCQTTAQSFSGNPAYQAVTNASSKIKESGPSKENCRALIENYLTMAKQGLPISNAELNLAKMSIERCQNDETLKLDGFLSKKFTKAVEELQYYKTKTFKNVDGSVNTIDYRLKSGAQNTLRESKDMLLKSLIRENLMTLSESKKKVLIEENKIITNRFSVITEGVELKTKKQKNKIVSDLVNEAMTLNGQGFNQTLINEQFWDMIKSFFGNTGAGVVQMISERIVQAIITTLTPLDKNGWVANIIITTVGNIPPADYINGKIFSCDYISDKLSKGIVEGMARKIQNEKGMEGPIYDIIRNSMVEMAEDTSFGMKIETMIGDLICPMLSGVKSKMDGTAETLKAKALA